MCWLEGFLDVVAGRVLNVLAVRVLIVLGGLGYSGACP
jgi:hypothetical protein